jgi:ADP-heptose:LPS heptosyltransferase
MTTRPHVLVVRLDSIGDMLVSGPAIRAVAASARQVTVLGSCTGRAAAELLPGVDRVLSWDCPWILADPESIDPAEVHAIVEMLAELRIDEALILTSFHQSALPTALVLRMAGIRRVAAISEDYPGALLDVRVAAPSEGPEPERMLQIAAAAGYHLPPGDDGLLQITPPQDSDAWPVFDCPYVVVHPGTSAPARAYSAAGWRDVVERLCQQDWRVAVTGSVQEKDLTAFVASGARDPSMVADLGGGLTLRQLADVVQRATVLAVANTGPAHLAAAVGTPVVSLFAPVVPAARWAPYGVPHIILGDQHAPCRGTRARHCPVAGHPCLGDVAAEQIAAAVCSLAARRTCADHAGPRASLVGTI